MSICRLIAIVAPAVGSSSCFAGTASLPSWKAGKPVGVHKFIGRRPIAAFGNSDGDYEMLRYVTAGKGPRFGLIVHHTDAERESADDRKSHFGRLDRALTEAPKRGWVVADRKKDGKVVFAWKK